VCAVSGLWPYSIAIRPMHASEIGPSGVKPVINEHEPEPERARSLGCTKFIRYLG